MGAGVSAPEGRRILQEECHSSVPAIDAHLSNASIVGCNSLRAINSWYRVHADDHKLVAKIVSKRERRPFILPRLPVERNQQPEESISLDGYLDELMSLQSKRPTTSFSSLDDADAPLLAANASRKPSDERRKLSRQDSRLSNRSDGEPTPSPFLSASASAGRPGAQQQPPSSPSPTPASSTLAVPSPAPGVPAAWLSPISAAPAASPAPFAPIAPSPRPEVASVGAAEAAASTADADNEGWEGAANGVDDVVEVVDEEDGVRVFLTAFLDVLYTARQRRASSVVTGDFHSASASPPLPSSSGPPSSSLPLSRRHLRAIHPNLPAIDEVLETASSFVVLTKHFPRTLASFLRTGSMRSESDEAKLFLLYQLLQCLSFLHERCIAHGDLKTRNVMVTGNGWVYLTGIQCPAVPRPLESSAAQRADSALMRWVRGDLSNFDYLMELNRLAGREPGATDVADHPILPWVSDFSAPVGALRDLTKSKFRLKKGDDQLDFTYLHPTSIPHHITELFSDITYYVYLARVTPLPTLKKIVRERFVAAEYPPSMARIFAWTPDECIPEFYSDPSIFVSRHRELGLEDLQVPPWCASAEEFVRWHRAVLEGDDVSRLLNDWIDITFGYKLSGEAAVQAKNVPLRGNKQSSRRSAFVQLFDRPHPKRMLGGGMREEKDEEDVEEHKQTDAAPPVIKAEEERKEGDSDAASVHNGEEAATDNGDTDSASSAGAIAAPVASIDYSIRNLHLMQEAASFDAVYTALEGCYLHVRYRPPTAQPADVEDLTGTDADDLSAPPAAAAVPAAAPSAPVYHSDSLPEAPAEPAPTPPPPPPPLTPVETLRVLQADDIFSLGCVISELFLGHPLFSAHTHRLFALGQFVPSLSSIPLSIERLLAPMLDPDPSKRPTAAALLQSPVFTKDDAFAQVYAFISELRRQQSMFSHSPPAPPPPSSPAVSPPPPAVSPTPTPLPATAQLLAPPQNPYLSSLMNSSFLIPSDDIHTPPVRSSALMDAAMITPPEFSPLALVVKEREREERERGSEAGDDVEADEGLEEEVQQNAEAQHERGKHESEHEPTASPDRAEPITRQQLTLDWTLDQLDSLASLPVPIYLLLLPHALSLTSHPELFIPSISLITRLSAKLGPSLSTRHLSPILHTLLLHVANLDLQCELLSFASLRTVYSQFSYQGGARDFVSYCRNSLLSPNWRISEAAASSLYALLIDHLDLNADADQEIAVRDVLLPIMSRIGRSGSDVLLKLLVRLLPELNVGLIRGFFLPHALSLMEKGASASTELSKQELDVKLSCSLDLLYAMLPDLPLPTLQSLLSESNAIKGLLAGTARGLLSVVNVRRLLRILLFIVVEYSGEHEHVQLNEHRATSAIGLKNLRLILPLLPLFADFLNGLVQRIDAMREAGAHTSGGWDASACYEFTHTLYTSLSITIGPTIVRKAVANHVRIEAVLAQGPPAAGRGGRRKSSLVGVQNVFAAVVGASAPVDLTKSDELDHVVKHGVLGRVRRAGWEEREERRSKERRERVLKERHEEGEVLTLGGGMGEVHENWLGMQAEEERAKTAADTVEEVSGDDEVGGEDGEDGFVKLGRPPPAQVSARRQLNRAATMPALVVGVGATPSAASKSFFSFLSSSSASSSIPLTMDLAELWSVDLSTPFKLKAAVKQTLQPHSSPLSALCSHPSNAQFITAARDDVVKVWSVGIGSGEVHAGAAYRGHKGLVTEVELLMEDGEEEGRWVGSCDGSLHVWDIETAVCVLQSPFADSKQASKGDGAVTSAAVPHPGEAPQTISSFRYAGQRTVLLGTSLGQLRHLDLRSGLVSGIWRHLGAAQPVAAVRCIARAASGGWLATGLATGEVTVMEERTGIIRLQWRAHDAAVLALHYVDPTHLLSTGADKSVVVWDISGEEVSVAQRFGALDDACRSALVLGRDFIGAVGGKLGVATLTWDAAGATVGEKKKATSKMTLVALKGSKSRGALTSVAYMPNYRLMLVGAEDGKLMFSS